MSLEIFECRTCKKEIEEWDCIWIDIEVFEDEEVGNLPLQIWESKDKIKRILRFATCPDCNNRCKFIGDKYHSPRTSAPKGD